MGKDSCKNHLKDVILNSIIALGLFLLLFFIRPHLCRISLKYGEGQASIGSLILLAYGFYLIYISSSYFHQLIKSPPNTSSWKVGILKRYLLLLLFCCFITLLFFSNHGFSYFLDDLPGYFYHIGMSMVFPVSLYTLISSISSIKGRSNELKRDTKPEVALIILSLLFLFISAVPLWIILTFWIQGGIRI